ncbi:probable chitinase 10 [Daphnia carinata]|uniref:probable chitinase 10 n=1 Tax=Daphnia carinata TaxID=120202 RepID=UPI00258093F2|nr:probable chitinase 10 [Daphnia carinata]
MNRLSSMLLAFAIFQCSFVFSAADINLGVSDFKCPTGHSIYPHPERCELYYTCYNTEPTYLWQCRSNLLFDLVYDGCNWPDQTYCGNRTRPDEFATSVQPVPTTSTPSQPSLKPITCPDDGFYPEYTDRCSSHFYTCLDGQSFSTYCPSYGVFEPVNRRCVSPNALACKSATPTTSAPILSTPSATKTSAPAATTIPPTTIHLTTVVTKTTVGGSFVCPSNGTYPDPAQCSNYYVCDNGTAFLFTCPSGLVFNPAGGVCDWPSSVPSCNGK